MSVKAEHGAPKVRELSIHKERVRGFQPPWYTVTVYECECGQTVRLKNNWHGSAPRGAIRCTNEKCTRLLAIC